MPSAANGKSEKPASSEAADNTPVRQILTIIEHKIRNLEKRKSKLTSYRDLQKAGKELNREQKVAVAKYDEVVQTLEFARDLYKQVTSIATTAEREAKKQAKKDAWVRYTADTNKIREVLLILDCLMQMGNSEARDDFLNGTNGATKLSEEDLKILDDLYPEVTPKHEINEEGQAGFHVYTVKAAEHLYGIIDGKPKEVLGTTYTHIKEIINAVHQCGYFDKSLEPAAPEPEECQPVEEEEVQQSPEVEEVEPSAPMYVPPVALAPAPVPPAPSVVPAPPYAMRPLPPITLQEVEHAYFSQQYPQQRPISEVIGSQNFVFLQESEIDSPISTPQPPIMNQGSPPPIPTQTFTNQHYVRLPEPGSIPMPPQPHFPPHPEHAYAPVPLPHPHQPQPLHHMPQPQPQPQHQHQPQPQPQHQSQPHPHPHPHPHPQPQHHTHPQPQPQSQPQPQHEEQKAPTPVEDRSEEDIIEGRSPEREDDRKAGQGDGQNRFRRYRGGGGRGSSNGFRGRGSFQNRQSDGYRDYRAKDGYQRQYDGYQSRHRGNDAYYSNGDTGDAHHAHHENGTRERERDRYHAPGDGYQGFKSRGGRGGPRGGRGAPRHHTQQYARKPDNLE